MKPFLFEVMVRGKRFIESPCPHESEAHRVAEGVFFVHAPLEKLYSLQVEALIHPHRFHKGMFEDRVQEIESRFSRQCTGTGQRDKFHEDVVVEKFSARLLQEPCCQFMLGLIAVVVAEKS
ncbi:MAG TPA: hypothetical protein VKU02_20870 [Gemmataceae bacterium]|nr:hypothetical protein [Gemmataceae bacterium]